MDAFGTPSEKQVRPEQSNDQHQAVAALFPVAATRPHLFTRPAEDERLESRYFTHFAFLPRISYLVTNDV